MVVLCNLPIHIGIYIQTCEHHVQLYTHYIHTYTYTHRYRQAYIRIYLYQKNTMCGSVGHILNTLSTVQQTIMKEFLRKQLRRFDPIVNFNLNYPHNNQSGTASLLSVYMAVGIYVIFSFRVAVRTSTSPIKNRPITTCHAKTIDTELISDPVSNICTAMIYTWPCCQQS